jgi:hypothetical protein
VGERCRSLDIRLSDWCCSVSMVWIKILSRENTNLSTEKSHSNTIGLNFQTYINMFTWNIQQAIKISVIPACHWLRGVWGFQRCNQNQYIEEEQTTQWPKEKVQKDKGQTMIYKTLHRKLIIASVVCLFVSTVKRYYIW